MTSPLFGSGPFVHVYAKDAGPADPIGYYLNAYLDSGSTARQTGFPLLWRYVVPVGKKVTAEYLNIHYSHLAVSGFATAVRGGGVYREAVTSLLVDGSTVLDYEGRGIGAWEGLGGASPQATQYPNARDADLSTKFLFEGGIAFTAGQVLTATAAITNLSLTIDGIHPQVHRIRLFGYNTATSAPMFINAVVRPMIYGTATYAWNDDTTAVSYTVPSGGFTLLSVTFRTDIGLEWVIASHAILYLNDVIFMELGPLMQGTGINVAPILIPLYGIDFLSGDVLELRGSPGVDCGQVVSVFIAGTETSLGTYSRNRVWSP